MINNFFIYAHYPKSPGSLGVKVAGFFDEEIRDICLAGLEKCLDYPDCEFTKDEIKKIEIKK